MRFFFSSGNCPHCLVVGQVVTRGQWLLNKLSSLDFTFSEKHKINYEGKHTKVIIDRTEARDMVNAVQRNSALAHYPLPPTDYSFVCVPVMMNLVLLCVDGYTIASVSFNHENWSLTGSICFGAWSCLFSFHPRSRSGGRVRFVFRCLRFLHPSRSDTCSDCSPDIIKVNKFPHLRIW